MIHGYQFLLSCWYWFFKFLYHGAANGVEIFTDIPKGISRVHGIQGLPSLLPQDLR